MTNGTAVELNWLPWKRIPSPDQTAVNWFLCSDIRCKLCTRKQRLIGDHCRCFQAGLKWNSLLLFITHCSIMNVRKVERAAVIYFQGIRGDEAVLWEPAGPAAISWVLRENPVLSHNKRLHFQSMQIITAALSYWFNGTHNIFMKY